MRLADLFRQRVAYTVWSNGKVLDAASTLNDEELTLPREGTAYGSLAKDVQHLIDAQNWWESVMIGAPTRSDDPPVPATDVIAALRARFAESHAALGRLANSLTEEALDGIASYTGRSGDTHSFPRWQMFEHVTTHGAQHRGEIGMFLHKLGHSPGDLDFLDYIESMGGRAQ